MTILKLGGSVVTRKEKELSFRKNTAASLAKDIAEYRKSSTEPLVLVHGAGSFGHSLVRKLRLLERPNNPKAAAQVHQAMHQLSSLVVELLLKNGIPAAFVCPTDLVIQKEGRILKFPTEQITLLLKLGITPVLSGAIVPDTERGFSICSGDQIIAFLSNKFSPSRVFFATDVDGVYEKDPRKHPGQKPFSVSSSKIQTRHEKSGRPDVTGEMQGKLQEIAAIKAEVRIFNGLKKGNLLAALQGEAVGTLVSAKPNSLSQKPFLKARGLP